MTDPTPENDDRFFNEAVGEPVIITGTVKVKALRLTEGIDPETVYKTFPQIHRETWPIDELLSYGPTDHYLVELGDGKFFHSVIIVHPADISEMDPDMTSEDEHQHDWGIECHICHLRRPPRD